MRYFTFLYQVLKMCCVFYTQSTCQLIPAILQVLNNHMRLLATMSVSEYLNNDSICQFCGLISSIKSLLRITDPLAWSCMYSIHNFSFNQHCFRYSGYGIPDLYEQDPCSPGVYILVSDIGNKLVKKTKRKKKTPKTI